MSEISRSGLVRTYERYAPIYDSLFGLVLAPGRREAAAVVERLRPSKLLEVGVGTGLSLPLYPDSTAVVGIDLSEPMLERAHLKVATLPGRKISLHRMDAEEMNFNDDTFDCVVASYVLSVTPCIDRLVAELQRVCKPDGTIIVINHFSGSRFWWALERVTRAISERVGFRSDFRFNEQMIRPGWAVESVKSVNLFGLSKLVVLRNR